MALISFFFNFLHNNNAPHKQSQAFLWAKPTFFVEKVKKKQATAQGAVAGAFGGALGGAGVGVYHRLKSKKKRK